MAGEKTKMSYIDEDNEKKTHYVKYFHALEDSARIDFAIKNSKHLRRQACQPDNEKER